MDKNPSDKKLHIVFQVLNYIKSEIAISLSDDEQILLIILASHQGKLGIFPSISTLAKERQKTPRSIQRSLLRLVQKNLLIIERKEGKANRYWLCIPLPTPDVHDTPDTGVTPDAHVTLPLTPTSPTPDAHVTLYNKLITKLSNKKALLSVLEHRPSKEHAKTLINRFDDFWKIYPRKENKKKAMAIWKRKKLDAQAEMIISDVLARKVRHQSWLEGFIPHATTYLNGERWQDAITEKTEGASQSLSKVQSGVQAYWDRLNRMDDEREVIEHYDHH